MTQEEKMKALEKAVVRQCTYGECDGCKYFEPEDDSDGEYFCGIRDNEHRIPYHKRWNMKIAFGFEEPYKPVFPEAVEKSIMNHFTRRD